MPDLAIKSQGYTYPNPLVESVIVRGQKIISEGWHKKAGESCCLIAPKKSKKKELKNRSFT